MPSNGRRSGGGYRRANKWPSILQPALIIIVIVAALTAIYSIRLTDNRDRNASGTDPHRAILIDGIALTKPNPAFTEGVKRVLSNASMNLDIYEDEEATIDLLRRVGGYGLIILRVHSAVESELGFLYLFSAEKFNETEYWNRFGDVLMNDLTAIREGKTFENESYFALRADLLGYMNKNGLDGSIIILMGCNGTNSNHAVNKLFERGVRAIIAWDGYVDLGHTDKIILELLRAVYVDGMSFPKAVEAIMDRGGIDPIWKSKLRCLTPPKTS